MESRQDENLKTENFKRWVVLEAPGREVVADGVAQHAIQRVVLRHVLAANIYNEAVNKSIINHFFLLIMFFSILGRNRFRT